MDTTAVEATSDTSSAPAVDTSESTSEAMTDATYITTAADPTAVPTAETTATTSVISALPSDVTLASVPGASAPTTPKVDAVAAVAEEYFAIGLHGHDYKWWGSERCMKEFTEKLKLNISHVDKAKGKMVAFLEFNSKADRDTAITALEGVLDKKGKPAYRIKTDVKGKPQGQRGANSSKRKAEKNADGIDDRDRPSKKQKDNSNNHVGIFDRIRNEVPEGERVIQDAVTPLWRLPYEEQLRLKGKDMENILRKWAKEVKKVDKSVQTFGPHGGTLCPLEPIVPSPVTEGYRNKCTFAIGVNQQGLATAGFTLSSFDASVSAGTYIESPADCKNTPTSAVACADLMSAYARSTTGTFSTYDKASHTGLWRMLQVRSNEKGGELMVTVQINPTDVSNEQIVEITKGLIETFKPAMTDEWKGKCGGQKIVSLQIQRWDGSSNAAPDDVPTEVIWGCEFITQRLLGFEFRMSSNSFFQVNIAATEKLYTVVGDLCAGHPGAVLLDVCCGAGTIGISMHKNVKEVVGLEIVPDAVKDATHNAELNNVTNARYICGKAEETLKTCLEQYRDVPVIAVVDPPRAGLHHETLNALRRCNSIKTIVYVMCNPRQCTDNIKRLLGPCSKKLRQMPFRVVKAIPVDLFPHTPHTELVVMLERIEEPGASTSSSSSSSSLSSLSSSPSVPLSSSSSAVTTNFATEAIAVATTEALVIPTAAPVENLTVAAVTTPASTALAPGDAVAGPG